MDCTVGICTRQNGQSGKGAAPVGPARRPPGERTRGRCGRGHALRAGGRELAAGGAGAFAAWRKYLARKGSVTVNGVSLTVNRVDGDAVCGQPDSAYAGGHESAGSAGRQPRESRSRPGGALCRTAARGHTTGGNRNEHQQHSQRHQHTWDHRRDSGRPHGGPGRRRGSRERRRPGDGRRVRHRASHQLHGQARPRADLPHVDAGALPPARPAADGEQQPVAAGHQLHRVHRSRQRCDDRHLGRGPRAHGAGGGAQGGAAGGPGAAGPHLPAHGAARRRAGARRAHRGRVRPGRAGAGSCRRP